MDIINHRTRLVRLQAALLDALTTVISDNDRELESGIMTLVLLVQQRVRMLEPIRDTPSPCPCHGCDCE